MTITVTKETVTLTPKQRGRPRKKRPDEGGTNEPILASTARLKSLSGDAVEPPQEALGNGKPAGKRKAANIPVVRASKKAKGKWPQKEFQHEVEMEEDSAQRLQSYAQEEEFERGTHVESSESSLRDRPRSLAVRHTPTEVTTTVTTLPPSQIYWRKMTLPEPFVFNPSPAPSKTRGRQGRHQTPDDAEDTVIEPDKVTMADLCEDIRIGRTSVRGKDIERLRHEEAARKKRNSLEPAFVREASQRVASPSLSGQAPAVRENMEQRIERLGALKQISSSSAVQYRMVDGRLVIDETSLQVDRRVRDGVQEPMDHVEDNPLSRRLNSASFGKREKSERWDEEQTDNFYQALSMWGTDFELIAKMFMQRSRRQIKNKFIAEEKKDPLRIAIALKEIKSVDMDSYTKITGTEFREVQEQQARLEQIKVDFDEKLRQEAESAAEKLKEQEAAEAAKKALEVNA